MKSRPVLLGVFGAAHGVKGELRLKSYTADPLAIASYAPLTGEDGRAIVIRSARPLKGDMLVVSIDGVSDRGAAEALTNRHVYAPREALGTAGEEDEFFHADLIGLAAVTAEGSPFGRVVAVHEFGAGDILEIAPEGGGPALLLPFSKAVVPTIDVAAGHLVVLPPAETGDAEHRDD
jgi:16S rRNA processing protein RimM